MPTIEKREAKPEEISPLVHSVNCLITAEFNAQLDCQRKLSAQSPSLQIMTSWQMLGSRACEVKRGLIEV
jgi:hypothetical protein